MGVPPPLTCPNQHYAYTIVLGKKKNSSMLEWHGGWVGCTGQRDKGRDKQKNINFCSPPERHGTMGCVNWGGGEGKCRDFLDVAPLPPSLPSAHVWVRSEKGQTCESANRKTCTYFRTQGIPCYSQRRTALVGKEVKATFRRFYNGPVGKEDEYLFL